MTERDIEMIPVTAIRVLNPRVRNKAKFLEIVANISNVGMKKPITVSRRGEGDDGYDLVCGQGRLEAVIALGQTEIAAEVIEVPREERFIMSLAENMTRKAGTSLELAREVQSLKERGYTQAQIALKVDVSEGFISALLRLLTNGEERLIRGVERGDIPIAVAVEIAGAEDDSVQRSLREAYESGKLRGRALVKARRLIDQRRRKGKGVAGNRSSRATKKPISADGIVRTYNKEVQRQALLVKKARLCETRLTFIQTALRELFGDDNFTNLLKAESLETAPKYIRDRARAAKR
ncbi:MAG: plasmid partitioning protein RepB C-terminal domain-containing protein [Polyangiales bacterium]